MKICCKRQFITNTFTVTMHVLLYLPLNFKTIPQLSGDKARQWQHCIAMGDTCISNEILISAKCKKIFSFNKNSSKKGKKSKNIVKS